MSLTVWIWPVGLEQVVESSAGRNPPGSLIVAPFQGCRGQNCSFLEVASVSGCGAFGHSVSVFAFLLGVLPAFESISTKYEAPEISRIIPKQFSKSKFK